MVWRRKDGICRKFWRIVEEVAIMTIYFTEQELKWIEKEKLHWFIKKECPQEIKFLLSIYIITVFVLVVNVAIQKYKCYDFLVKTIFNRRETE